MHHLTVVDRVALAVGDVPAQGFEEGVEEFLAQLRFIVTGGAVAVAIVLELLDELMDDLGCWHGFPPVACGGESLGIMRDRVNYRIDGKFLASGIGDKLNAES